MTWRFVSFAEAAAYLRARSVVIVGSAPSVLLNAPGFVDAHEVVVRVNNYRTSAAAGFRCDVFYSYFGGAVRKTADELKNDGVRLCWNKCPNGKPLRSEWHEKNNKPMGVDFRYIFERRKDWWFCDTFVPTAHAFLEQFEMLDRHIPTTGFSAIVDVLACQPRSVHLTGFDMFTSGVHNVNEKWRPGNAADPIGHRPDIEARWLAENMRRYPITMDTRMRDTVEGLCEVAA